MSATRGIGRDVLEQGVASSDELTALERDELATYRRAFAALAEVAERAAAGDLEARVGPIGELADVEATRWSLNRVLDLIDAFVREAGASLVAASEQRYHRAFLVGGFGGAFAEGARTVNQARDQMALADQQIAAAQRALTEVSEAAVQEVEGASHTIGELDDSSQNIKRVVTLIRGMAIRTRMLSLNASIEAARAGEAGRGFAVVATEVKQLSDETRSAVDEIERQVDEVRAVAERSADVLTRIAASVRDMHEQATRCTD